MSQILTYEYEGYYLCRLKNIKFIKQNSTLTPAYWIQEQKVLLGSETAVYKNSQLTVPHTYWGKLRLGRQGKEEVETSV